MLCRRYDNKSYEGVSRSYIGDTQVQFQLLFDPSMLPYVLMTCKSRVVGIKPYGGSTICYPCLNRVNVAAPIQMW